MYDSALLGLEGWCHPPAVPSRRPPRRRYIQRGRVRYLLEFNCDPNWPNLRCALCGMLNRAHFANYNEYMGTYRFYPGRRYIMDGFVALCDGCRKKVVDHHSAPETVWVGVPIIRPLNGVAIEVFNYGYADDTRVAGVVANLWRPIPRRHQRRLREYITSDNYRNRKYQSRVALGSLRIEALPRWPNWGNDNTVGVNLRSGHVIRIWAGAAQQMPQPVLTALVGHELAHTYELSQGSSLIPDDVELALEEFDADEVAIGWGCDIDALHAWGSLRLKTASRT